MGGRFARPYQRFRSGKGFLIFLAFFCIAWMYFNWRTKFDPEDGLYNTILSTEASFNGTVIVMMAERFETWVREQMTVMVSSLKQLTRIGDVLVSMDARLARLEARHVAQGDQQ